MTAVQMFVVHLSNPVTTVRSMAVDRIIVGGCDNGLVFVIQLYDETPQSQRALSASKDQAWEAEMRMLSKEDTGLDKNICFIEEHPFTPSQIIVVCENGSVLICEVTPVNRVVREVANIKKGLCHALLLGDLTVENYCSIPFHHTPALSKYPLDGAGDGYLIPSLSSGTSTDQRLTVPVPSLSYNKVKRKRALEQAEKAAAIAKDAERAHVEQTALHLQRMTEITEKNQALSEMALKLQAKIAEFGS
jgi:hypothetical protein